MGKQYAYPRTMTKGDFKGTTFQTKSDYEKANRDLRKKEGPKYRQTKTLQNESHESQNERRQIIRKIIDSYEMLVAEGVGTAKAVDLMARIIEF